MNILPKKSWHVLSRPNIERVRRDEAAARAEEEERAKRAALAEQEARLQVMRKRVREREGTSEERETPVQETKKDGSGGHINFFADIEHGVGLQLSNVEHEAEKKAEQEKWEKRVGLLNYLVDNEKSDQEPWYVKRRKGEGDSAKVEHKKELMDPLKDMKHFVTAKKKHVETTEEGALLPEVQPRLLKPREEERHKEKKHKHKRKTDGEGHGKKKKADIEELRRERRRREEAERTRTEALLRRHHGGGNTRTANSGPQAVEDMPGRYNSQFNPHLARQ